MSVIYRLPIYQNYIPIVLVLHHSTAHLVLSLESCHRDDRQIVLPQQALKPEHLQAEYRMNGEKGRTRARKRLWEIVKTLLEFVRLYWQMGRTPAPNSYCTPTSLSAQEIIGLDQCWAVLTFVSTGRFRFLHSVTRTWSLFESTYVYMCVCVCVVWACENQTDSQVYYFFQTQPLLKYGDSCLYNNNRFSYPVFTTPFSFLLEIRI
jgi:hypothetical protein